MDHGSNVPTCQYICPCGAIDDLALEDKVTAVPPEFEVPAEVPQIAVDRNILPSKLSLAIRGIGGQGNLFFGRVLTQVTFLAGYSEENIVKGETHGMAQVGGPVISTFSCGRVHSAVLLPGTVDCLITMEAGELLRPGFFKKYIQRKAG